MSAPSDIDQVIQHPAAELKLAKAVPGSILTIDIGGSKIKCLLHGQTEPRRFVSGPLMVPQKMVDTVRERPVRILNDAALQALGSYEGGRMLFLGLGTGLGSTLISQNTIIPLELGCLPSHLGKPCGEILSRRGLRKIGKRAWREAVKTLVHAFLPAFEVDYVVLGGGNAKIIKEVPAGARVAHNQTAFRGGFRLWHSDDIQTLESSGQSENTQVEPPVDWRVLA